MTAARDDEFMALPGMEADSNAHNTARHRLGGAAPVSSKSVLDGYRVLAKSERLKAVLFGERDRDMMAMA